MDKVSNPLILKLFIYNGLRYSIVCYINNTQSSVISTFCAGMTCHARREPFVPKLQHFLSFKYILSITQTRQVINLLLLNHFCPVIVPTSSKGEQRIMYAAWSLVTVRSQLPAQVVNKTVRFYRQVNLLISKIIYNGFRHSLVCYINKTLEIKLSDYIDK